MMKHFTAAIIFLLPLTVPVRAQNPDQKNISENCRGPIYGSREVTRRARITGSLDIHITEEALGHDVHGRVVIEAVLCRTGRVTDLRVIESLPYGMTEIALEVVRHIRFTQAEKNFHTVSQRMQFEFHINERGSEGIIPRDAAGRLVEAVEIMGNRRPTAEQILAWARTRPGEPYSSDQVTRDLNAILATGYFDKLQTRVSTENGSRGGVMVIFEVFEMPVISEVKFEGLKYLTESAIFDALLKENIDVRKGAVYDPVKVRNAVRVIRNLLESSGQRNANVEVRRENVTATAAVLTFVVSE